jgi:two-component system, OmpR family, sensor kinase
MFQSVRSRLTFWYTAILALVLVTFSGISYALLARAIRSATDSSLAATAHEFTGAFSHDAPNRGGDVLLDFRYSDREIMVFNERGQVVASSPSQMSGTKRQQLVALLRAGVTGFRTLTGDHDGDGMRIFAEVISVIGKRYTVVVAQSLNEQADRLDSAAHAVFLGIPLALLIAAGGGYLMARKSLAPVALMSMKARQIGAATLSDRIEVGNERDELGYLAATLNDLLERLQRAFESQQRFMADASHELRTPLSIIQGEADVVLSRDDRRAGEYRESIQIMQAAATKLTRIVQNLFLLVRTDAGRYPVRPSRFYLDELLADCVRALRSVAVAKRIQLSCDTPAELLIEADEELIHRLMLNLIDNALKFTPEEGHVTVRALRSASDYQVTVTDTGSGIALKDQPYVFDRFFRGDRARTWRDVGTAGSSGAGLGLSIAKWIAEVHGGAIRLESSDGGGTTFTVKLPASSLDASLPLDQAHETVSDVFRR